MTKYIFTSLFILLSTSFIFGQEMTAIDAVTNASQQRMLTQKMLSYYLQIGSGVNASAARSDMDASVAEFEELMLELAEFTPNPKATAAIEKAQASWRVYSLKLLSYPNKTMGTVLLNLSGKILQEYDDLLALLSTQAQTEKAELINLAGRQGMLAQRMNVLYLALNWELPNKTISDELDKTNKQFSEAIDKLKEAEVNTPQIAVQLDDIAESWEFTTSKFGGTKEPSIIMNSNNSIVTKSLDIVQQYTATTELTVKEPEEEADGSDNEQN